MEQLLVIFGELLLLTFVAFISWCCYELYREKEARAIPRVLVPGTALVLAGALLISMPFPYKAPVLLVVESIILLGCALLLVPRKPEKYGLPDDTRPVDERNIMFSRMAYTPGGDMYEDYYTRFPERKQLDDRLRAMPPLYSPETPLYDDINARIVESGEKFLADILKYTDGPSHGEKVGITAAAASRLLKKLALYFGADIVGITGLKPYHTYSHHGRRSQVYGKKVDLGHKVAIAFGVAMDYDMIRSAPHLTSAVECSQGYVKAAIIGMQLSYFLRFLGYKAINHMSGDYKVVAPLVAADAGLGEIGRMGILISDKYGSRLRLGVVTTDLELAADAPVYLGVQDFCEKCVKCARECPSSSIPAGPKTAVDGIVRWKINQETCFGHWRSIGSDCGICLNACPYNKPDSRFHRLTRWLAKRSGLIRWILPYLDDYLYGRKPYRKMDHHWVSG